MRSLVVALSLFLATSPAFADKPAPPTKPTTAAKATPRRLDELVRLSWINLLLQRQNLHLQIGAIESQVEQLRARAGVGPNEGVNLETGEVTSATAAKAPAAPEGK